MVQTTCFRPAFHLAWMSLTFAGIQRWAALALAAKEQRVAATKLAKSQVRAQYGDKHQDLMKAIADVK